MAKEQISFEFMICGNPIQTCLTFATSAIGGIWKMKLRQRNAQHQVKAIEEGETVERTNVTAEEEATMTSLIIRFARRSSNG